MIRSLTDEKFRFGSYRREDLGGTLLQRKLRDRGVSLTKSASRAVFRDEIVGELVKRGAITKDAADAYQSAALDLLMMEIDLTTGVNEDVLRRFYALRLACFGAETFRAFWREEPGGPHTVDGLDQRDLASPYLKRGTCFFYASESAFLPDLLRDINTALADRKRALCLAGDEVSAGELPSLLPAGVPVLFHAGSLGCLDFSRLDLPGDAAAALADEDAFLFGYGEDALLACHDMNLPALATVTPRGMPARAVIGTFTHTLTSRVFIPAHFSIFPTVPLTERTRLSFYQLDSLARRYGESVYQTPWRELARRDPGIFLNVYDDHLPPRVTSDFHFTGASFDADRRAWCDKQLASFSGIRPLNGCFALPDFAPVALDWESKTAREQILVDGVLAAPGTSVQVISLDRAITPRALYFERKERGSALLSNFNFFFTSKLLFNYNGRLADRPREQIDFSVGTLDYYRFTDENGVRHETLPLYNKAVLAGGRPGFSAFDYRLSGGKATLLPGLKLCWTGSQVNAPHPELTVYTPLVSVLDEEAESRDYLRLVGEGRLNITVIGEKILCARRGDVSLPCIGTVFSLGGDLAAQAEKSLGEADENGYFDVSCLPAPVFRPDPPEGVSIEAWEELEWAYGGGLSLIGADGEITRENYLERFRRAGWLSPLSQQTQESRVHTLARHPRTAVGVTKKGELFVLVVSGRTPLSVGADYMELCRVARLLVPELSTLINWDGGGSSVLGLLQNDVFCEINYPAPSDGSVTGMARAVTSLLRIDGTKGGKA